VTRMGSDTAKSLLPDGSLESIGGEFIKVQPLYKCGRSSEL
jgi:hypothetical protein